MKVYRKILLGATFFAVGVASGWFIKDPARGLGKIERKNGSLSTRLTFLSNNFEAGDGFVTIVDSPLHNSIHNSDREVLFSVMMRESGKNGYSFEAVNGKFSKIMLTNLDILTDDDGDGLIDSILGGGANLDNKKYRARIWIEDESGNPVERYDKNLNK